ncbi:MAG: transporter [Verrucomicrobiota bacterium]
MNPLRAISLACLATAALSARGEDLLDRADEALTFAGCNGQVGAHLSGLLDLEFYQFNGDPPGLLFADGHELWNSRLTLLFDAQIGSHVYLFAQARLDRGFDPSAGPLQARLEEYALRWTPGDDGRFNLQAGRFATIVGNYIERHQSWENPFINAPLIYEHMTELSDAGPAQNRSGVGAVAEESKYEYLPVIWGPSYATGLAVSGRLGKFDYAAELKNSALSSRPETWDAGDHGFAYPTLSARLGYRPDMAWALGMSAGEGAYLTDQARAGLPSGTGLGDFKQYLLGQDLGFASGHWQLWAEVYEARFDVPHVGNADTLGYYLETKYKFTPNLFGALRWNQQFFDSVPNGNGGMDPSGNAIWRIDTAVTYRFTPRSQLKLQYSLQHEDQAEAALSHLVAAQFTLRF